MGLNERLVEFTLRHSNVAGLKIPAHLVEVCIWEPAGK